VTALATVLLPWFQIIGTTGATAPATCVANGWQIASTIATFSAAIIALIVVVINLLQRQTDHRRERAEKDARSLAQAQLVLTGYGNPGFREAEDGAIGFVVLPLRNLSERPVLLVTAEVWREGNDVKGPPLIAQVEPVVPPEAEQVFNVPVDEPASQFRLAAWRIRWTDADGARWCYDRWPQDSPDRYTGQDVHPY